MVTAYETPKVYITRCNAGHIEYLVLSDNVMLSSEASLIAYMMCNGSSQSPSGYLNIHSDKYSRTHA